MSGSALPASVVADLVAAARGYLRLADGPGSESGASAEMALLERLAVTAVLTAEAFCGEAIVARAHEDVLPVAAGWQRLAARPVTAIAGVTALPAGAAPVLLALGSYAVDIDADGDGWVRVAAADGAALVAVSYSAGRAASFAAVPAPVAQGLAMLAAHLFEARDGATLPPAAVAALWRPYRRLQLAAAVHS